MLTNATRYSEKMTHYTIYTKPS